MENLRKATLVFLVKKSDGIISEICLGFKKRGFATGKWNGVGGKVEDGESIEQAAIRETLEEIYVKPTELKKAGEFSFYWTHNPEWDQIVHVYYTENWEGEPTESEEIKPAWFTPKNLPWSEMWPDDKFWMPYFLKSSPIQAKFKFDSDNIIIEQEITEVEDF